MPKKSTALFLMASLSCCHLVLAASKTYQMVNVKDGGTITGRVAFSGTPPRLMLPVEKDEGTCCPGGKKETPSPRLVVGKDGGVKNVVVFLLGVSEGKPFPKAQPALDQKKCIFEPHIVLVPLRGTLEIRNSDPILHNVHGLIRGRDVFNVAMPTAGMVIKKRQRVPGIIAVQCDAGHTWMSAYVFVVRHPYYAVTDEKGRFKIDGVPPGRKYKLRVWKEGWQLVDKRYRPIQTETAVELGREEQLNLEFVLDAKGILKQTKK